MFCVKCIKTLRELWIKFKFLEKPVDFSVIQEL